MRVHHSSWRKDNSKGDNNIAFTIGMNTSVLEGAISEQLFCNKKVNPNNEPCYGISTVSGLQRVAQQGQKIYQINQKNREQLKNIAMSGKEMASDINKAIASGGYVIVTEKAIDGAGRNAIYVYMTYNAQDGYQTWKISGGLNGGSMSNENSGNGKNFIETLILTILGVSTANAQVTNKDVANETAKTLIPWYGHLLNLLDLWDYGNDLAAAGCSGMEIVSELVFYLVYLLLIPGLVFFWLFASFIIAAIATIVLAIVLTQLDLYSEAKKSGLKRCRE